MSAPAAPALVWFRRDLRLDDNPALTAAIERGGPVVALYVLDDEDAGDWRPGGASRWWLHRSLEALDKALSNAGSRLVLRRGKAAEVLDTLIDETGADAVYWNRRYEPWAKERDTGIKTALKKRAIEVESFKASLLYEPWEITTKQDTPFKVFSPFWREVQSKGDPAEPLTAPKEIDSLSEAPAGDALEDWALLPTTPDWAGGLRETWTPGEAGAAERLDWFLDEAIGDYKNKRNFPGIDATSALSPHLHFGEISPRRIWHAARLASEARSNETMDRGTASFLSEICWREFSYNLLFHNPDLPEVSLRREFEDFPWRTDAEGLKAWQRGLTGYPIVDAGMRQLWHTGWMHNRVRMIVASFLIKDLLIHWREGEAWFWDTLVDADLANNAASWQWVAGCGADAAPYFRVFNPVRQSQKFDPDGAYIRRWIPELADVEGKAIHEPWTLEGGPPEGYPEPIVDHAEEREEALRRYQAVTGRS